MNKPKKKFLMLVFAVLMTSMLVLSGCGSGDDNESGGDDKVVMKYSHGTGTDDPHHWTAEKFKELVEDYSDGKVEVEIYPNGQLGSEQRGFQDVQNQVIQASSLAVNNATPFSPSLGFFDLPYIFQDREEFYTVIDTMGEEINERMIEESGNRAIIWFDQGFRHLTNSEKPVESLEDLQGLEFRVPENSLMLGAFKSWDAKTSPIAWDETFNALQQGVVDGQENPYTVINSMKFQEVQDYITEIHYKMWIGPVVVNEQWLQEQPEEIREAIIQAGQDTMMAQREWIQDYEDEIKEKLADEGMEISGAPEDEEEWKERAMAIWPDFYDDIGGKEMVSEVMDVLDRDMPE